MKYIILIGDGMADAPLKELGDKTPLEAAKTPNMDRLASTGRFGVFKTVPDGYPPGSDVANLSILGYDPRKYYTGRAPLEAASIGVELKPGDVAFRCNLVTLDTSGPSVVMADYSAGHITTEEASLIIATLDHELASHGVRFYTGKSYRHLMVISGAYEGIKATPPHDISDRVVDEYLPAGVGSDNIRALMKASEAVLKGHPVNVKRLSAGKNTADSIWLWGQGKKPSMPTLKSEYGITGGIISAVDLMNGIGVYAGLEVIKVPGITGYIDTDYDAKASYALKSLETKDFVCVHVEAPDEAGHQGKLKDKLQAIEDFDKKIVGAVTEGAKRFGAFRVAVLPDHPTPLALKTHTRDAVPFVIWSTADDAKKPNGNGFTEKDANATGVVMNDAATFIKALFA
jgi:2,3-bisphosphoglycerate-independent phosphoglycerate mutase